MIQAPPQKTLKQLFLEAPDSQLGSSVFSLIEKWTEPEPTALEILEVMDSIVYGSLSSVFTMMAFSFMFKEALKREGKTEAEVLKEAHWRKEKDI